MIRKQDLHRLNDYLWEIPTSFNPEMKIPVWIFANDELIEDALGDLSITQAVNVACLPTLVGHVAVMPDLHQGYGMPIGGSWYRAYRLGLFHREPLVMILTVVCAF